MTRIPLLSYEVAIVAALAGGNQSQAAARLGMSRFAYRHQLKNIIGRIQQAGGDPGPILAHIRLSPQRHKKLTDLRGDSYKSANRMLDANDITHRSDWER